MREAGFTEQRKPPSPNGGGLTGCCSHCPLYPSEPSLLRPTLFTFFCEVINYGNEKMVLQF